MAREAPNHRRAPRFRFVAEVEMTDVQSGARTRGHVENVSQTGCYISTANPSIVWSHLKLLITRNQQRCEAEGLVVHTQPNHGMGVSFEKLSPPNLSILNSWLRELAS